ncbi:penicillin-insensitive murein endopeptidase [Ghiorsea bivora]|uniref:penicillin-insensitive murein endopeptidase n=1 Tax=Ghiorsea bivora TaxID=1485545 RepID=UPI00056FA6F3|nr:penicillin-insensitive murein endopeptidase [Ghiorsea bivora]
MILSLPDGSTQSFTYTGGTSAPIPFSYAVSEPVGSTLTFTATATSNSGATSKQPATATANVIAGGLNVTITPAKVLLEPRLRHRADVKPSQVASAYKTPVDILVTDMFGVAITGASVSLTILTVDEGFGGHDHGNWLPPKLIIPKPKGIIFPASGTTITGHVFTEYIGNEISSLEKIEANVYYQGCSLTATSSAITSEISNLTQLAVNSPHFKIGGTDAHHGNNWNGFPTTPDNNHWVSSSTAAKMNIIMTEYPKKFSGAGLYINDASLPKGGRFDAKGNWLDPHQTHRRGIDIDVHTLDSTSQNVKSRLELIKLSDKDLFREILDEGNHLHIYFYPN